MLTLTNTMNDIYLSDEEVAAAEMMTGVDIGLLLHKMKSKLTAARRRRFIRTIRSQNATPRQLIRYFNLIGWKCVYCGIDLDVSLDDDDLSTYIPYAFTVDHITPIARGGNNKINNIVCACRYCNEQKSDLPITEFLAANNQNIELFNRQLAAHYHAYISMTAQNR